MLFDHLKMKCLGLTFMTTLSLTSCSTTDDNDINEVIIEAHQPNGEALEQAFLTNRDEALQTTIINAETGGSFIGEQGTELIFNANSFLDTNGNPVTGDVSIKEIIKTFLNTT